MSDELVQTLILFIPEAMPEWIHDLPREIQTKCVNYVWEKAMSRPGRIEAVLETLEGSYGEVMDGHVVASAEDVAELELLIEFVKKQMQIIYN